MARSELIDSLPTIRSALAELIGSKNTVTQRRSPAVVGVNTGARAPMTAPLSGSRMVQVAECHASWA